MVRIADSGFGANIQEFILYSEPVIGNPYETAKKLLKEDAGNEELLKIIFDYENTIGLPGDDLFD